MDEDKKDIDKRGDYKIKESIMYQMSRIWIVLILFMTLSTSSTSENTTISSLSLNDDGTYSISNTDISDSSFKGEPSYDIEVQASNSHVNNNDEYSMKLYISGAGDATFGKLRVNIPEYIVKDNRVTLQSLEYKYTFNPLNGTITIHRPYITSRPENSSIDMNVPNIYFNLYDINGFTNWGEVTTENEGWVPYSINFTIDPNAPGGDHNIYMTLFYKLGNKWYSSPKVVSLHVNRWYEKDCMERFAIIAIIASLFIQVASLRLSYLNNKVPAYYRPRRKYYRKYKKN